MKHIFLTGEIQIGKSTVIEKTLSLLRLSVGGFSTYFGPDRENPDRCLYMGDAALPPCFCERHVVAHFCRGLMPEAHPERFDALGVKLLSEAREKAQLIIMDECGNLESGAQAFQIKILDTLADSTPVLGVVKLSAAGWVDDVRYHPGVRLMTVDRDNRDSLPELLAKMIGGQLVEK